MSAPESKALFLTGSSSINLTGQCARYSVPGNAAGNVLDGGAGVDTMTGCLGNDTYVVDSTQDVIVELAGGGNDTVRTDLSYVLAAELENVTLTGTGSVDATGNGGANRLVGNAGNNVLSGGAGADTLDGGAGADTLIGGTGDDTYVVADAADTLVEIAGEGTDTVQSSIAWSLAANLENLVLTGGAAVSAAGTCSHGQRDHRQRRRQPHRRRRRCRRHGRRCRRRRLRGRQRRRRRHQRRRGRATTPSKPASRGRSARSSRP